MSTNKSTTAPAVLNKDIFNLDKMSADKKRRLMALLQEEDGDATMTPVPAPAPAPAVSMASSPAAILKMMHNMIDLFAPLVSQAEFSATSPFVPSQVLQSIMETPIKKGPKEPKELKEPKMSTKSPAQATQATQPVEKKEKKAEKEKEKTKKEKKEKISKKEKASKKEKKEQEKEKTKAKKRKANEMEDSEETESDDEARQEKKAKAKKCHSINPFKFCQDSDCTGDCWLKEPIPDFGRHYRYILDDPALYYFSNKSSVEGMEGLHCVNKKDKEANIYHLPINLAKGSQFAHTYRLSNRKVAEIKSFAEAVAAGEFVPFHVSMADMRLEVPTLELIDGYEVYSAAIHGDKIRKIRVRACFREKKWWFVHEDGTPIKGVPDICQGKKCAKSRDSDNRMRNINKMPLLTEPELLPPTRGRHKVQDGKDAKVKTKKDKSVKKPASDKKEDALQPNQPKEDQEPKEELKEDPKEPKEDLKEPKEDPKEPKKEDKNAVSDKQEKKEDMPALEPVPTHAPSQEKALEKMVVEAERTVVISDRAAQLAQEMAKQADKMDEEEDEDVGETTKKDNDSSSSSEDELEESSPKKLQQSNEEEPVDVGRMEDEDDDGDRVRYLEDVDATQVDD